MEERRFGRTARVMTRTHLPRRAIRLDRAVRAAERRYRRDRVQPRRLALKPSAARVVAALPERTKLKCRPALVLARRRCGDVFKCPGSAHAGCGASRCGWTGGIDAGGDGRGDLTFEAAGGAHHSGGRRCVLPKGSRAHVRRRVRHRIEAAPRCRIEHRPSGAVRCFDWAQRARVLAGRGAAAET